MVRALALRSRLSFQRQSGRPDDRGGIDGILFELSDEKNKHRVVGHSLPYSGRIHHGCLAREVKKEIGGSPQFMAPGLTT